MDALICPKGHLSTEPDYCSECGAKIAGTRTAGARTTGATGNESWSSAPVALAGEPAPCPECGTLPDGSDVVFCEICGYNFVTGARGELPFAAPSPSSPRGEFQAEAAQAVPGPDLVADVGITLPAQREPGQTWEVTVTVDPSLREPGSPPPPPDVGPFVFSLTDPVSLVGRRSDTRAIYPQIALGHDDAVSHRHALLQLEPGGSLSLRDIGASNGTRLNGTEIAPMVDHPLRHGDCITLGHWTRLVVQAVP